MRFYEYVADHDTYVPNNRVNPRSKAGDGAFEFAVPLRGRAGGVSPARKRTGGKDGATGSALKGGREVRLPDRSGPTVVDPRKRRALIRSYLSRAIHETESLALRGIDPKAAGLRHGSPLRLGAVYTALMVKAGDTEGGDIMGVRKRKGPSSALGLLDRHRHLVLLGDPGSGKSTFVNFVAMCLAGEGLERDDFNVGLMTAPPPDEKGEDSDKPQPWRHGALLPIRVVLRDLVAWEGFSKNKGGGASSEDVWNFIRHRLEQSSQMDCAQVLKDELLENGGIVLFDGLDEVSDSEAKRERIKRAVEDFAVSFPECRILVTSRTYAYESRKWKIEIPKVAVAELAPFTKGQVHRFIDNWHAHVAQAEGRDAKIAAADAKRLRKAVFDNPNIYSLAERPLLLTLIASLHSWRGGSLPENRQELYEDTVDLLLDLWESQKTFKDEDDVVRQGQPSLAEFLKLKDRRQMRRFLNRLAFEAHKSQDGPGGPRDTADIPEDALVPGLLAISPDKDLKPKRLVEYLSDRAGLIVSRGEGVYAFPHRTFQEYLAACHLTDTDYPCLMAELARTDPERWREAALLAGAKSIQGIEAGIWLLSDALCRKGAGCPQTSGQDVWGAHIAGRMLAENIGSLVLNDWNRPKLNRVKEWLKTILAGDRLPAKERVEAGNSLSALGDDRFDPGFFFLPKSKSRGFLRVEVGPFPMGSTREEVEYWKANPDERFDEEGLKFYKGFLESEYPRHTVRMSEYFIARYPVTVDQFRCFIRKSGYKTKEDWETDNSHGNHPVVNVSWEDAMAYCQWLSEQFKRRGSKYTVSLPTEAQWEKAARGVDGRTYPWGNEDIDTERANYYDTGVGETSPAGCFPKGNSPCGASDMVGNVWEWCLDHCEVDFEKYRVVTDTYRENLEDPVCRNGSRRVVRGGSWVNSPCHCRAARRFVVLCGRRYAGLGFRLVLLPGR